MKRFMFAVVSVAVVCFGLANSEQALAATDYSYDVTPADLADGPTFLNGRGGVMFGYDTGPSPAVSPPEGNTTQYAPGFASGSFYSNVQGSAAGGRDYTSFRMSPRDIFGGVSNVTISDLSAISYYTKWVSGVDWQIKIYTEDEADPIQWYQTRFEWNRPSPVDNAWNQYTADGLKVGKLTVKDTGNQTIPGTGLLSDLDALYGAEKILFIDIIASYMTDSPPSYSYLDGVKLTLDSEDTATMNLEAVPEPVSIVIWGLLGAGCAGGAMASRRRRRVSWSDETRHDIHQIIDQGRTNA